MYKVASSFSVLTLLVGRQESRSSMLGL